jgi:putative transposase
MPNHYHLLLVPKIKNGISKFMKKVDMGYAKYFNQKYDRKGTLFERRYKSIQVTEESHFIHLPYYLHCNPLDLIQPEWREGKLSNYKKAIQFLESYRWSSHLDYLGKRNFSSVTKRDFLLNFFEGETGYREALYEWLKNKDKEIEYDEYE